MFDSLFDCRLEKYIFKVKYLTFYIDLVLLFHYSLQVFGIQMKCWTGDWMEVGLPWALGVLSVILTC